MKLNKKQKRTATIASMAALLAVVLGMGGQTFAKYITTNTTVAQTATVAKWGLVLNQKTEGEKIFNTTYGDTVASASATDNVVAPGTSGETTYLIDGTAEVDAKITFSFEGYDPVELAYGSVNYKPVKWFYTVDKVKTPITDPTTWKLEKTGYEANTEAKSYQITISWVWDFETVTTDSNDEDEIKANKELNNKHDTILGGITNIKNGAFDGTYKDSEGQFGTAGTDYTVDNTMSFQLKAVIEQVD